MKTKYVVSKLPFAYVSDINQICEPLFRIYGFNYFDFGRFYHDGSCILLFSDPAWVECFLTHPKYEKPTTFLPNGGHLWQSYIYPEFLNLAKNEFNHDHGITFCCNHNPLYSEVFNFSAPSNQRDIYNIYLNNREIIDKFIKYFLETARPLIDKNEKEKIFISPSSCNNEVLIPSLDERNAQFENLINPSRFKRNFETNIQKKLTPRESIIFQYLIKGLTAKEIGKEISISFRTVEKHIENIKNKLGNKSKLKLILQQNIQY